MPRHCPKPLYVADTIRLDYPDLDVPYHSRWRHFEVGGWIAGGRFAGRVAERRPARGRASRGRPGDPPAFCSTPAPVPRGASATRPADRCWPAPKVSAWQTSRSSPVAPLVRSGPPLRSVRRGTRFDVTPGAADFQVRADNPLVGLGGRAGLLRRLGEVVGATPAVFGEPARLWQPGRLLSSSTPAKVASAPARCWPPCSGHSDRYGRGVSGCRASRWAIAGNTRPSTTVAALHKLTQWLTYSLLEPLELAGLEVTGLDALTGLPEYRKWRPAAGLRIIRPRNPEFWRTRWRVDATAIVEWRPSP